MSRRQSKNATHKTKTSTKVIIDLVIAVSLIFVALYLVHLKHKQGHQLAFKKKVSIANKKKTNLAKKNEFDFYTILPKMTDDHTRQTAQVIMPTDKDFFSLQISSVHDPKNFNKIQDELGAMGIETFIKESKNKNWYKLLAGPYLSREKAQQDQAKLQRQHIKSILVANHTP